MMLKDLVLKNRSYRRFYEEEAVPNELLYRLVDLARQTPSGMNLQPLKYILSTEPQKNARIFSTLHWAGYLKDWPGPQKGERPAAYIIMLRDLQIAKESAHDEGIAAQTILLGAAESGYGGCILGNIDRDALMQELCLDSKRYYIALVLALGRIKENVVLEPLLEKGDIRYYRDEDQIHHVPKRSLEEVVL